MIFRLLIITSLVAGMFGAGCQTKSTSKAPPHVGPVKSAVSSKSKKASPTEADFEIARREVEKRARAMAHMMTGNSYEYDKPELALEEYYQSALLYPSNQTFMVETARRLLQDNQAERAIHILSKATNQPTATATIYALLARAYLHTGATNQAIAASQTALKKLPDSVIAFENLAEIYFQIDQPAEAINLLEQAAKQPKVEASFLINLAESYAKYLRLKPQETDSLKSKAIEALNRAVKMRPKSPTLQQKMAETFNQFGERNKAAAIYLELIEDYSDLPLYRDLLREKLANVYLLANEKARAAEQLEAMIRDNPTKYPQAYYVLGTMAFGEKNFEKAADHFSKAILTNPDLEQAYYDLAGAQINLNKGLEALETLRKARLRFPQNFVNEFYSGLANQRLKNYSQALKHYTTAEVIAGATEPKHLNHGFYFQVGSCFERDKQLDQAEKYFQKCLEQKPDDAEALNYLGYMWAENDRNLEKARELIEKAVKLDPKNGAYLDSLGWVLFKLKQPEQALTHLLQALEYLKEPDPTVLDHLGDVYSALKKPDKARESWQKSFEIEPNEDVKKKLALPL